jgi:chemotaxis protein methyltransferase CheR
MKAEECGEREFAYSDADFERVRALIRQYAGIALSKAKADMVYSRLARCIREQRLSSFTQYLDRVEAGDAAARERFTNALTTNLTSFFREEHHFPILREHLQRSYDGRMLTVWCSAASTGEEPYSIAMTAIEAFNTPRPPVRILASDIATHVLAAPSSSAARASGPASCGCDPKFASSSCSATSTCSTTTGRCGDRSMRSSAAT